MIPRLNSTEKRGWVAHIAGGQGFAILDARTVRKKTLTAEGRELLRRGGGRPQLYNPGNERGSGEPMPVRRS